MLRILAPSVVPVVLLRYMELQTVSSCLVGSLRLAQHAAHATHNSSAENSAVGPFLATRWNQAICDHDTLFTAF